MVVTATAAYVSRVYIEDTYGNLNTILADSGTGNFGTSKSISATITADIFDHVLLFYCSVVGNGSNIASASLINPTISLGVTVPT